MSFYEDVIKNDPRFLSTDQIKDINLLEHGTRLAVLRLIDLAKAAGHDLRLLETFRSQARQMYVFQQGYSKLSRVGCHGYGLAADFGVFIDNKYATDGSHYLFLPDLCKEVGLISGIDWGTPKQKHTFIDSGHVQRIPVWRQQEVFSGEWYPPEDYNPYEDDGAAVA